MNPEDVLLWWDGFWCFRKDYNPEFAAKLGYNYRIIPEKSDEWQYYVSRLEVKKQA